MKDIKWLVGIVVVLVAVISGLLLRKNPEDLSQQKAVINLGTPNPTNSQTTPMLEITQLKIEDIKEGTGSAVKAGDTVVINYEGTLLNGQMFDSSYKRGQPFETQIGVGRVIKGWDEGVIGMKIGGKRKLTIPSDLAYGAAGIPGAIPPNSPLLFTLELLEIK